ncbi:GNAT family N-acetyltransferase [Virgibacillus dakarensis]|uniref:GNAT family N-acetyltransferase n=1 Tax=Virgibacillus dakarensis TaxID=1917889 RepID=UPI000B44F181|nr:GNAT family N-acetyltransferase [Virgibacillus dakarensis]MBT2217662.1 GNAT family N-acetyltransferase [Virgibacillus dakarensis]MTW86708.1 GNAT family N-acetyltransferase [Virgibacillus dakarensis]
MNIIDSERFFFRPYCDNDFMFLISLLQDPEMMRYIGNGQTRDREGVKQFLDWIYRTYESDANLGLKVLVRKEDNVRIGHAGLVPQTVDGKEEIEIGYWIARDFWGHGYATEAAKTLRNYGIHQLGRQRFIALIQTDNIKSQQVAKKIGMTIEKEIILLGKAVFVYSVQDD